MPAFTGKLNPNEVMSAIYNMILSQIVLSDNIYETKSTLIDMFRTEGGLYGDQKLFYATDVLRSVEWMGDDEAANLLKIHRPPQPNCQAIILDQFRLIPLTVDRYLSKRGWSSEGVFSQFISEMLSWMGDTKRIHEATLFNSFIGTNSSTEAFDDNRQNVQINLPAEPSDTSEANLEAYNRMVAETIATEMANLLVELADVSRNFNDYQNLRSFNPDDLVFVWNSEWVNKIRKYQLPTIFHKDGLIDKFAEHTLPPRFFGNINVSSGTTGGSNVTVRSLREVDYNDASLEMNASTYDRRKHIFPGDLLPDNTPYEGGTTYSEDPSIILKIVHKRAVPWMNSFSTGTAFNNNRSLTETHFTIWGYNTLEHLKNYPFITVKAVVAAAG